MAQGLEIFLNPPSAGSLPATTVPAQRWQRASTTAGSILGISAKPTTELSREISCQHTYDAGPSWWEVDGIRDDLTDPRTSTSEIVQAFLPGSAWLSPSYVGVSDEKGT